MEHKAPPVELAYTHAGIFHADDVMAAAFLRICFPQIQFKRVTTVPQIPEEDQGRIIVFDTGGGKLDHHTKESAEVRPSNSDDPEMAKPYAAFGKVVREYWDYVFSTEDEYIQFDRTLCVPIDYFDNAGCLWGGAPSTLSNAISSFNGFWNESHAIQDERFRDAVTWIEPVIRRGITRVKSQSEADYITEKAVNFAKQYVSEPTYIVLRKYTEYGRVLHKYPSVCWVCYPSMRGGWQIFSVKDHGENRDLMDDAMIEKLMHEKDVNFVHPSGFTATFATYNKCIEVAKELGKSYYDRHPIPTDKEVKE